MDIIRLKRVSQEGKAVRGSMRVNGRDIATLENADYIIPVGTYPVLVTFSPRFKRMLPLSSTLPVFLYMVETQREDLKDDFVQNFHPVFFFAFSFHFRL